MPRTDRTRVLSPFQCAGPWLNAAGLAWLYAHYCFDYKWALHGVALQARLAYFERHWAFFLGALRWAYC